MIYLAADGASVMQPVEQVGEVWVLVHGEAHLLLPLE